MSVKRLLEQKGDTVYRIAPDATVHDCIELLNAKRIGALVVMDDAGVPFGIVSERDILRVASGTKGDMSGLTVRKIMTPADRLVTAEKDDTIRDIMSLMTENRIRHVPIVDDGKVVGIVSIGDAVKMLLDDVLMENKQIKDYISGEYA